MPYSKEKRAAYMQAYQADLKGIALEAKCQPCADCGRVYHPFVMDFDHVRGVKKFNVSKGHKRANRQAIEAEIAKCDVVCSNCHRMRTLKRGFQNQHT